VEKKTGLDGNRTLIHSGFLAWCNDGSTFEQDIRGASYRVERGKSTTGRSSAAAELKANFHRVKMPNRPAFREVRQESGVRKIRTEQRGEVSPNSATPELLQLLNSRFSAFRELESFTRPGLAGFFPLFHPWIA